MLENAETEKVCWYVGACYHRVEDQTDRFLEEGIWENGYDDKNIEAIRSIKPGDLIAIKSAYTQKHDLPFDNRGNTAAVMAIKAIGTVTENLHDGKRVRVSWKPKEPPRKWYFYTNRKTIWRLVAGAGNSDADALAAFAFDKQKQDIDFWRNRPFWRERFGDKPKREEFLWTAFYEAVAEKLLEFKDDRAPLVKGIHKISHEVPKLSYLQDKFKDKPDGPLEDICPFTTLGIFNRTTYSPETRTKIAAELAKFLNVEVPAPTTFDGVPVLHILRSWFFGYAKDRGDDDIEKLWKVFAAAQNFVKFDPLEHTDALTKAYDAATQVWGVKWNLSTGLYWAHPWEFPTLDKPSRTYIEKGLGLPVPWTGTQAPPDAAGYLAFSEQLKARFNEDNYPVHNFPELSLASRQFKETDPATPKKPASDDALDDDGTTVSDLQDDVIQGESTIVQYSIDDIIKEGSFLSNAEIKEFLDLLRAKKNLILQGPPGTGKTWIAKRLAFALMNEKDDSKVRAVQFHPNLSYEDFVRGWRPTGDGKLALVNGVFMEAVHSASNQPNSTFVVVIEEINRGNPAQIFGEFLTLLEAGKRTPSEALELCYPGPDGNRQRVHVPENLYVIGTMNIADRSLALVDLAFRRRFAFATLKPMLKAAWQKWVTERCGIERDTASEIQQRIDALNETIGQALGDQFKIGHSYVTPTQKLEPGTARNWFTRVAKTEIGPLLDEYWVDSPETAKNALEKLIEGW